MADWASGYVTDTAYVHSFCRVQTPPMLALAALAGGVAAPGAAGEPLTYCDLGCGQGYTANLVAAANPTACVHGFDVNPSHIAGARALASAGRVSNVEFREADFEELLADSTLPDFDIMCMHGVYGWIGAEVRKIVLKLIGARLKPGGLLYVSYNCMPGWAAIAPLRSIFARSFAPSSALPSPAAIEQALAYWDALRAADSRFQRLYPQVEAQIERMRKMSRAYLVHELLPGGWQAFSFGDLVAELAQAKLVFLGSAHLTDGVDRVNFTEAQLAFLATLKDPVLAESTRDMLLGRQFRHDVFVKGSARESDRALRGRWLDRRFALTKPSADVDMTIETALGKLQLRPDVHAPLIDVFRQGPTTLGEAIERSQKPNANWISVSDAIKVLVGGGDLSPASPASGDAARAASTRAFNAAILQRVSEGAQLSFLASPVTGGGVQVDRATQLYLLARRRGVLNPAEVMALKAEAAYGAPPDPLEPDAARAAARKLVARIETDIAPMLQGLGIE